MHIVQYLAVLATHPRVHDFMGLSRMHLFHEIIPEHFKIIYAKILARAVLGYYLLRPREILSGMCNNRACCQKQQEYKPKDFCYYHFFTSNILFCESGFYYQFLQQAIIFVSSLLTFLLCLPANIIMKAAHNPKSRSIALPVMLLNESAA